MSDSKARYSEFCRNNYVPLHLQPWWLDAVCGTHAWDLVLTTDKNKSITGVFPYFKTRRWGIYSIQLPPLTAYGGPWLVYPQTADFKPISRLSFEKKVMTGLIRQLPGSFLLRLNFRPEINNWLPFYWAGFRQTTRYTYLFPEINDLKKIRAGFKNTLRSDLKKAWRQTELRREDDSWKLVFELNKGSFQRKNKRQPYTLQTFSSLHNALQERQQSAVLLAFDKASGKPSAGLYLVFDERQASVLITGTAPEYKSQGAIYTLLWEAIRFCAQNSLSLDFEGSMDARIERSFRGFGARLTPYFRVWKFGGWW